MGRPVAAVVTVGTELTNGLRADTNGGEIARRLRSAGYAVDRLMSVPDDESSIARALVSCLAEHALVVVTGGLGPTHDDRTREAAAHALGVDLVRDPALEERMRAIARRHATSGAAEAALRQADVLQGARVLPAVTGSAPGQVVAAGDATLVLLPGPPNEMRPILEAFLGETASVAEPRLVRCAGITESDAGARVGHLVGATPGVGYTLLASTSSVDIVLFDDGAGATALDDLALAARAALAPDCYSTDGSSLAEVVIECATARGVTIACAESCTGGGVATALTDVAGASAVFLGGVVAYANDAKIALLDIPPGLLAQYGAVSEQMAVAMAEGALVRFGADLAVSVTGIAGPGGGGPDKPVGLVWFGLARAGLPASAAERRFGGDRPAIRARATTHALDLVRRALEGE